MLLKVSQDYFHSMYHDIYCNVYIYILKLYMYVNKSICFFHFCTKCAILSQIDVQNLTVFSLETHDETDELKNQYNARNNKWHVMK